MPFQSEKQRRYLWANEPEIARDWADTYGSRIEKNDGGIMRVGFKKGDGPAGGASAGGNYGGDSSGGDYSAGGGRSEAQGGQFGESYGPGRQGSHHPGVGTVKPKVKVKKGMRQVKHLKTNQQKRNLVLAMRKLGLLENQKVGLLGGLYQGLTGKVPEWAEGMTEAELNAIARTGPYLGADDAVTAKSLESGTELLGTTFKGGPFNTGNVNTGGGGGGGGYKGYPSYEAWLAAQGGGGGGGTTATTTTTTPSAFQESLTGTAETPDYYVGDNPLASNTAWGQKFGVDPRTMGRTSWADGGRIPAAFGGIMDRSTGRRAYGLGSIFKSIKKAASKVLKSPIGKAALIGGLGAYSMGMGPFSGGKYGAGFLKGALSPGGSPNQKAGWLRNIFSGGKGFEGGLNPWKIGIGAASALPFFMGGPEEDEDDKGVDYDLLKNKYASELMNIKRGVNAGSLDPNKFSYLPSDYTYTGAEGGRAGYYTGGQSIPSPYTMEDARKSSMQDKMGGITDVMKRADLYRSGDVGQMYRAQGGRIGYRTGEGVESIPTDQMQSIQGKQAGGEYNRVMELMLKIKENIPLTLDEQFELRELMKTLNMSEGGRDEVTRMASTEAGQEGTLEDIYADLIAQGFSPREAAKKAKEIYNNMQQDMAHGGRIGFNAGGSHKAWLTSKGYKDIMKGMSGDEIIKLYDSVKGTWSEADGGRIGAEEGGLMDLGGMEKDYRAEGGFVPIGGKEKADDVPARLSKNEFVFTADAVRGAGGGDIDQGAEIMENVMKNLEQGGQISEKTQGLGGAQEMFDVSERLSEVV